MRYAVLGLASILSERRHEYDRGHDQCARARKSWTQGSRPRGRPFLNYMAPATPAAGCAAVTRRMVGKESPSGVAKTRIGGTPVSPLDGADVEVMGSRGPRPE